MKLTKELWAEKYWNYHLIKYILTTFRIEVWKDRGLDKIRMELIDQMQSHNVGERWKGSQRKTINASLGQGAMTLRESGGSIVLQFPLEGHNVARLNYINGPSAVPRGASDRGRLRDARAKQCP